MKEAPTTRAGQWALSVSSLGFIADEQEQDTTRSGVYHGEHIVDGDLVITPQDLCRLLPIEPRDFDERWAMLQEFIDLEQASRRRHLRTLNQPHSAADQPLRIHQFRVPVGESR